MSHGLCPISYVTCTLLNSGVSHARFQGIALIGAGMILNFLSIQIYVIDAFTLHAASGIMFTYHTTCRVGLTNDQPLRQSHSYDQSQDLASRCSLQPCTRHLVMVKAIQY